MKAAPIAWTASSLANTVIFAWEEPDPALTIDAGMRNAFAGYSTPSNCGARERDGGPQAHLSRDRRIRARKIR